MKIKQEFKPKPLKNEAYEEIQFPIINLFKGLIQEMKTKGIHIPEEIILQGLKITMLILYYVGTINGMYSWKQ